MAFDTVTVAPALANAFARGIETTEAEVMKEVDGNAAPAHKAHIESI